MEDEIDQNTYVKIEYNNTTSNNDNISNECVVNDSPILISNDVDTSHYITCYENGQIVLKQLDTSVIESVKLNCTEVPKMEPIPLVEETTLIKNEIEFIKIENDIKPLLNPDAESIFIIDEEDLVPKKEFVLKQRNKLCYEKPYNRQPAFPKNPCVERLVLFPRKQLIIDDRIMISPREFKLQLENTVDTIATPELAPCTRQQIRHVVHGITRLFAYPAHKMPNSDLMKLYVSHCTCKNEPNMVLVTDLDLPPIVPSVSTAPLLNLTSIKRFYKKRKCADDLSAQKIKRTQTTPSINVNIDHKYSKKAPPETKLATESSEISTSIVDSESTSIVDSESTSIVDSETVYSIAVNDLQENLSENHIMILTVDDGEMTENNLEMMKEAENSQNLVQSSSNVITVRKNLHLEGFNDKLNNIIVLRPESENDDDKTILGINSEEVLS